MERPIENPILRYPGSKWRIAGWIYSFIVQITYHTRLIPYCGGLNEVLQWPESPIETVNDIDGMIVNLFRVIREHPDELARLVYFTPWSRLEYESIQSKSITKDDKEYFVLTNDPIENARRMLVRCWMSFGGKTACRSSWSHNVQKQKQGGV